MPNDPLFDPTHEVQRKQLKFGKVGDWFKGTIVDNSRQIENKLSAKREMQTIYEFKAQGGSFHGITDLKVHNEPTVVEPGGYWSYFAKPVMHGQLKDAKIGQIVGLHFSEERKSEQAGRNPAKIIKVYMGDMYP